MKPHSHSHSAPAQGALEYLLLIGGAVLVATIILVIALGGIFPNAKGIINTNIDQFQHAITLDRANLGGGGGTGGAVCGNGTVQSGEACDDGDTDSGDGCSATCTIESGYNCTGSPSICTPSGGGGAPGISTFTAVAGTGLGELVAAISVNDNGSALTYLSTCTVDSGVGLGAVASQTNQIGFNNECGDQFGNVDSFLSSPSGGTLSSLASNSPFDLALMACNGNGCVVSTTLNRSTLGMASFLTFNWDTMTAPLVSSGTTSQQVSGVQVGNSATSPIQIVSVVPTMNISSNLTIIDFGGGPVEFSGAVSNGGTASLSSTYALNGSVSTVFAYDAPVHTDAAQIGYQFNFLDSSSTTVAQVPNLNIRKVPENAFFTCSGTTEGSTNFVRLVTDITALGGDRGLAQQFTIPSGSIQYASAEYYVNADTFLSNLNGYFNLLGAWDTGPPNLICENAGLDDDVVESGVGFGAGGQQTATISGTGTGIYRRYDVEGFLSPGTTQQWVLTGGNVLGSGTTYRQIYTSTNSADKPALWIGYT